MIEMEHQMNSFKGKGTEVFRDIPDGYFEQLPKDIASKIAHHKASSRRKLYLSYSAAAVLMISIVIGAVFMFKNSSNPEAIAYYHEDDSLKTDLRSHTKMAVKTQLRPEGQEQKTPVIENKTVEQVSDSLTLDMISYEEIMDYLLTHSEYEF